jgi:hypothetical protein
LMQWNDQNQEEEEPRINIPLRQQNLCYILRTVGQGHALPAEAQKAGSFGTTHTA